MQKKNKSLNITLIDDENEETDCDECYDTNINDT